MQDLGGGSHRKKVKGITHYLWYVPSKQIEQQDLYIPDMKKKEAF